MNSLPLFLALLSLVAAAFVLVPLWRHRGIAADHALEDRREKNREVFRQREAELLQDLQQGLINEDEHARLLAELQRAFLLDMEALDKQGVRKGAWSGGRALLLALALLVPAGSYLMYRSLGSGPDLELPRLLDRLAAAQTEEEQRARFDALADFLQQRQQRRPDDVQNGYTLGKLYLELERFEEAAAVFESLLAYLEPGPDRAVVLGQVAQSRYLVDGSTITPRVQEAIDEALSLNPNEYAVMGLYAIDALLKQDFQNALAYWRRQLSSATPGSQEAQQILERIGLVESYMVENGIAVAPEPEGPAMTLTVNIAPELRELVTDDMRLFVFVRNPQMPMPIMAKNVELAEFPITVTLSDADAPMGGGMAAIQNAPQIVAGARLTRSSQPTRQSGDLETLSEPFALSEQTGSVELVIDEIVP